MTNIPDKPQCLQPQLAPSASPRPIPRLALVLLGSACTGVAVAILSKDWCSTTFHSIWLSALLILLFDSLVCRRLAPPRPWWRKAQIAAIVAAVALFGSLFRISGEKAFKTAFGMPSPAGVRNLSVDCNFRLVDVTQLLHFTADRATIEQIVAGRGFRRVGETTEGYPQERDWNAVWQRVFGSFPDQGGPAWRNVDPMKKPLHFRWENVRLQEQVDVLWDAETCKAFVRYVTL